MIEDDGFEELSRNLARMGDAIERLSGELGAVEFDPEDPGSVEAAVSSVEQTIDERLNSDQDSDLISGLVDSLKETYRTSIHEQAEALKKAG